MVEVRAVLDVSTFVHVVISMLFGIVPFVMSESLDGLNN